MSELSYFLILSSVEKLCIINPKTSRLSSYLILWNISDASLGTEELGHVEMVSSIIYQLTRNLSVEEIKKAGFDAYFTQHTTGIYPCSPSGEPFSALGFAVKGDVLADLNEDLAAEQKARVCYDNLLRQMDDPDVCDTLRFLRERELVHYQRFGDALRISQDRMDSSNFYGWNPEFDRGRRER